MGNVIAFLKKHMFNRRKKENTDSHSRPDHPERLPVDESSTVKDPKQKRNSLSTITEAAPSTTPTEITIEEGAQTTTTSTDMVTPSNKCSNFYLACRTNNIEEVKKLLETITLDEIDKLEPNGSTALHTACYHGHEEIVELLLEAGADRSIHNKYHFLPFDEAKKR